MRRVYYFLIMMLMFLLLLTVTCKSTRALTFKGIESELIKHSKKFNKRRIKVSMQSKNGELDRHDLASDKDIFKRVHWLGYFASNREIYKPAPFDPYSLGWHYKDVWKWSVSIALIEGYFVDYRSHDGGLGFGWGAMHWSTAKWLANDVYNWNWKRDRMILESHKHNNNDKLQAKYIIGYLYWLHDYYNNDTGKAVTGYNWGTQATDSYVYSAYYLAILGRRHQIDKWLIESNKGE